MRVKKDADTAEGEGKAIPHEVIAQAIVDVSQGIKKMRAGRLNDKAIILLLSHASGISQVKCRAVFQGLEDLEAQYIKKKAK